MKCILSMLMSEQTREGERVSSVLSISMSEKIEDGERGVESMLNIWMSEHGVHHKHLAT